MIGRPEEHELDFMTFEAMNTSFYLAVLSCKQENWKDVMRGWFHYVENEWSRFRPGSELDRINKMKVGERTEVSPPLFDVLTRAEEYRIKTNGLFSPYLLPLLEFHGYRQSFPFQSSSPAHCKMPAVFNRENAPFHLDKVSETIKKMDEGQIDLGGIGKGYAVQAAAGWLQQTGQAGSGIVDGGGDMTVWSDGQKEWKIGVAHPTNHTLEAAQFGIKNGSVATSNILYRSWLQGNQKKHHLLNGKTGLPVESGIIQATVITTDCLDAEVMAKLCFMEEGKELQDLLQQLNPVYSVLTIDKENRISVDDRREVAG